jgi:X-Pro dipeptidyl-peptidase-like protein
MTRTLLAVSVAALICAGASAGARTSESTTQDVTITGAGGVQLACKFTVPAGTPPSGGWPGLVLFPGLGAAPPIDGVSFASAGFASISCAERGTGSSGGSFDLAGPSDAQDAQAIFDWLGARPEVSDTEIGAEGWELGGAEVWNAAAAGVPFKAIVPADTWSSLRLALRPTGVLNLPLFNGLSAEGPTTWNTTSGIAARSHRGRLRSLTVPTLILGERSLFFFDLSQATSAYRLLVGPKRIDIGWNAGRLAEVVAWLRHYLARGPKIGGGVEIQHEQPDTATTKFLTLPPTRFVGVNLPGTALKRSVWLTGGPLETFGGGNVTIRYTGASWKQVVATVSTAKGKVVTEGAALVRTSEGLLKIPLLNEVMLLPRGRKLTVTLSSHDVTFGGTTTGNITVGRVTLKLSVLQRAVSR